MASIFKRGGKKNRDGKYIVQYTDETYRRRTVHTGVSDHDAAQMIADKLDREAALRREGVITPGAGRCAEAARKPLRIHLDEFKAILEARGCTSGHVGAMHRNALRVITLCGASRVSDLSTSKVQAALGALRLEGLSARTLNAHLRGIKSLSRWLWRDGRTEADNLAPLRGYNEKADRRHVRRALTVEEAVKLVKTTGEEGRTLRISTKDAKGRVVRSRLSGPDRSMLYRTALGTGFRVSELRSLTRDSFDLGGEVPTVAVEAAYSKHRRRDVQPVSPELAEALRPWLLTKPAGRPVFETAWSAAKMLRVDLAAAEIPYRDSAGRVADFHSLRHSFITHASRSCKSSRMTQELARHSDPKLTANIYTHPEMRDLAAVVASMPLLNGAGRPAEAVAATGTDGRAEGPFPASGTVESTATRSAGNPEAADGIETYAASSNGFLITGSQVRTLQGAHFFLMRPSAASIFVVPPCRVRTERAAPKDPCRVHYNFSSNPLASFAAGEFGASRRIFSRSSRALRVTRLRR